jgi:GH24 family phage-related lysozyme (muramidase)
MGTPKPASSGSGKSVNVAPNNTVATAQSKAEPLPDDPFPEAPDGEQVSQITVSDEGIAFIRLKEGPRRMMYNDSQGHCTIGVGHLIHKGNCNGTDPSEEPFKDGLTDEQVSDLLQSDLDVFQGAVTNGIQSRVNQYQYDALVCFCINIGTGHFASSGVHKLVNAKQYSKVPAEMMKWVKPPEIAGRRADEAKLFRTGQYK